MSSIQSGFELTPEQFHYRFQILSTFNDPFGRQYILTKDNLTQKRAIYKHYLSQTQEQQQAILDNLDNYNKLSQHEGICKLLSFTKLSEQKQILAAFQYNDFTLIEYARTLDFQRNHNKFYVTLFNEMLEIIKMMVQIGIDMDEINFTNILVFQEISDGQKSTKIKFLYDERQKIYDKVIQGQISTHYSRLKTFTSPEKLSAIITNDQNYFIQNEDGIASENIYQLGLIMIDYMFQSEKQSVQLQQNDDFINRDRPVSRSMIANNEKSYYIFEDGQVKKDHAYIEQKIQYLKNVSSHFIKELTEIAIKMMSLPSQRLNLYQLNGQVHRVTKIFNDSQRKIVRSSSIEAQMKKNQDSINKAQYFSGFGENNNQNSLINNGVKKQIDKNVLTFDRNAEHIYEETNNFSQDKKIITSSKGLISEDVKDVVQSFHALDIIKNQHSTSNEAQNKKSITNLQNTKQSYSKPIISPTSVNDMGYKSLVKNNQSSSKIQNNFSSPVIDNRTKAQIEIVKVMIPRQQIFFNLKCHESVRGSLQNLINQIENLQNLIKKEYYDNSFYYGETNPQTNKRSGLGIYIYPQGDIYYGTWHQNQLINGTYIFKNGQSYQGQVKNGKQGWGRYRYINGNVYEGEWKNDIKEGKGTMWYPNQDKYEGMWHKGKKNGFGKYYYNNGTVYEGNFANGRKNGFGTISFTNGTKIEANWNQTHIQGQGKVFYPNGDFFEGEYHFSQKNGKGLYVWGSDQARYQGQFKKDTLEGEARIHFTDKQYYYGRIKNGKRDGQGTYQYQNGDRFVGEWKNDMKLIGNYRFVNGDEFQGKFKQNQLNFGVLKYANGQVYEGEFKSGYRNGVGSYKNRYGELVYEGHWQMDIFLSKNQ